MLSPFSATETPAWNNAGENFTKCYRNLKCILFQTANCLQSQKMKFSHWTLQLISNKVFLNNIPRISEAWLERSSVTSEKTPTSINTKRTQSGTGRRGKGRKQGEKPGDASPESGAGAHSHRWIVHALHVAPIMTMILNEKHTRPSNTAVLLKTVKIVQS